MGRPKQTQEQARLNGAADKHPERYSGTVPKGEDEIGDPPKYFSAPQKRVWAEIVSNALPGILTNSDRYYVEAAALLVFELRETEAHNKKARRTLKAWEKELAELKGRHAKAESDAERKEVYKLIELHYEDKPRLYQFATSRLTVLKGYLASLGMSPTDRQRLRVPEDENEDADEFEDL